MLMNKDFIYRLMALHHHSEVFEGQLKTLHTERI